MGKLGFSYRQDRETPMTSPQLGSLATDLHGEAVDANYIHLAPGNDMEEINHLERLHLFHFQLCSKSGSLS